MANQPWSADAGALGGGGGDGGDGGDGDGGDSGGSSGGGGDSGGGSSGGGGGNRRSNCKTLIKMFITARKNNEIDLSASDSRLATRRPAIARNFLLARLKLSRVDRRDANRVQFCMIVN